MRRVVKLNVFVITACGWLCAGRARANETQVVILEPQAHPAPQIFVEALRIQLAHSARVSERALASATVGASDARLARHDARLVLWLDESGAEPVVTVLGGRASVPLALSPALSDSPEVARVLALKVGLMLEEPAAEPKPEPRHSLTRAFVELRVAASRGGAPNPWLPSISAAAGPHWTSGAWLLEAHGSFTLRAELDSRTRVGETNVSSTYLGAGARALLRSPRFACGPFWEFGVETLRARGVARDNRSGATEVSAATTTFGLQARFIASESWQLAASGSGELWLTRERLQLLATPTVDFGRVRESLAISAIFVFH